MRHSETRAVITGGTQGLGLAIAKRLAGEGAKSIVISGRNAKKGEAAAKAVSALGPQCIFVKAEMGNVDDPKRLIATALDKFGSVNALVNSAAETGRGTLLDTSLETWEKHFNTNTRGPFLTMQGVVQHLVETGRPGSIVNILSMVIYVGQSYLTAYSSSKAALANLTRNTANAFATKRIRCNGINVGWMDTPQEDQTQQAFHDRKPGWLKEVEAQQPMGQLVKPDQLAGLVAYMLSPESGVMTGALVDYDQNVAGRYPE
ncbi:SDR family oxidoreductase [Dongia sedimenti]|uniref:SDR family oxidoreductase n=1 Tax=Dongia sedimenti TaxID=3064282 RepID=A0ABU0YSY5_9PROT|nr:SDR family oxidoreductase [Rhodospirillaceae bacterium R-7]